MKYNHKSETLVGFYLRLAVARQMRIRYQHQCVPAVWSLWRCALYWGALTVHTNIHAQGFFPPGSVASVCFHTMGGSLTLNTGRGRAGAHFQQPKLYKMWFPWGKDLKSLKELRLKSNTRENSAAQNCMMVDILWSFTELVLLSV